MPRPIPHSLMPSVVQVWVPEDGLWGGTFCGDPRTITGVRFDKYQAAAALPYVSSEGYVGRLYVDAHTSVGAFAIPQGSLLSIDGGEKLTAERVSEYSSMGGRVHHWEIDCR